MSIFEPDNTPELAEVVAYMEHVFPNGDTERESTEARKIIGNHLIRIHEMQDPDKKVWGGSWFTHPESGSKVTGYAMPWDSCSFYSMNDVIGWLSSVQQQMLDLATASLHDILNPKDHCPQGVPAARVDYEKPFKNLELILRNQIWPHLVDSLMADFDFQTSHSPSGFRIISRTGHESSQVVLVGRVLISPDGVSTTDLAVEIPYNFNTLKEKASVRSAPGATVTEDAVKKSAALLYIDTLISAIAKEPVNDRIVLQRKRGG